MQLEIEIFIFCNKRKVQFMQSLKLTNNRAIEKIKKFKKKKEVKISVLLLPSLLSST